MTHDFTDLEFATRRSRVAQEMEERGMDALLVVGPENIYYLTGLNFQGYFTLTMLVFLEDAGAPYLVARSVEGPTIAVQAPDCLYVPYTDDGTRDPVDIIVKTIVDATDENATVGVELDSMFFPPGVWDVVRSSLPNRAWLDASGLVGEIRAVKSSAELACVRRAATISDRAVQAAIAAASEDATEREVAAAAYAQLVRAGSEHPGFAPLIRSTDILTHEHVTWRDRHLHGSLLVELSASVRRYHAPMTRMLPITGANDYTRHAADAVIYALEEVQHAMCPGAVSHDVYMVWQKAIDSALGHGRYQRHHCGYTVGIGFPPSWVGGSKVRGIRRGSDLVLQEGMVFHVLSWLLGEEPADYCVSDTVVVSPYGGVALTRTPRNLVPHD